MPLLPDDVEAYAAAHTTPAAPHMAALEAESHAALGWPGMLTGNVEGRLLEMLVWLGRPRVVLEIGTFSGYGALSLAATLPEGGRVITLELDEERAAFARRHIEAAGYADRVEVRVGPALDTIAQLDGPFDLVFIDADKPGYRGYLEAVLPKLSPRGLVALDNTMSAGRVLPGRDDGSESAAAMRTLNDELAADERLAVVQLTVRDGVTLVRRRDA
jgi:caffeoyl-CoA O-methyltransferase